MEEARGAVAKAARRGGGGGRTAPRHTAVTADMLSTLLAGAPALVDYLLLEDSVRRWALGHMGAGGEGQRKTVSCRHPVSRPAPPITPLLL